MELRSLPHTDLRVPVVSLGTWVAGASNWGSVDDAESIASIQKSIDLGVTLIDTAPIYGHGHSEEVIGKAVKGRRDQVIISTKCGLIIAEKGRRCLTPASIRGELDDSLRRLGTDHVDVYFCHWPDNDTPIGETIGELTRLKSSGKIGAFGLSNHSPELVEQAAKAGPMSCVQEHYSLLQRDIEKDMIACASRNGLAVFAYGPLGGGILTGKYTQAPAFEKRDVRDFFYPFYREPLWTRTQEFLGVLREVSTEAHVTMGQAAIAWVNAQSCVACSLVGARNVTQAQSNAGAGDTVLTATALGRLTEASTKVLAQ